MIILEAEEVESSDDGLGVESDDDEPLSERALKVQARLGGKRKR